MFVLQVNAFPITVMFGMCSIFLFMAAILQRRLMVVSDLHKSTSMLCPPRSMFTSIMTMFSNSESDSDLIDF